MLWKQVICSCHNLSFNRMVGNQRRIRGPGIWPDIWNTNLSSMVANSLLRNGIKMMVGNGEKTRFWEDVWIAETPLAEKFPRLYSISAQQQTLIADLGVWDGLSWSWNIIWRRKFFEWELATFHELQALPNHATLTQDVADKVVWLHHNSGAYKVKSFLNLLLDTQEISQGAFAHANMVWRSLTPPNSELLLCILVVGKLNTLDRLSRLNIRQGMDNSCVLCQQEVESINHLFCYCPFTWSVWFVFLSWWGVSWVIPNNPRSAFESWIGVKWTKEQKKCWISWFYVIVWSIWELRNKIIFQHQRWSWDNFMVNLIRRGDLWVKDWRRFAINNPRISLNY